MSQNAHSASLRRSEDNRNHIGRQDSSAVEGPFSPIGLKVLVVDDDPMCLKVVEAMLRRCNYEVETQSNGQDALTLLRERHEKGVDQFDLVLSDVHMPDMDGFKLLEHIGLELDLPVIMMSSDGDTSVVLRGVTHGAVDFLIKPVRIEELRNVWQHVVRRRSCHISKTDMDSGIECDQDSRTHGTKRKGDGDTLRAEHEGGGGNKKARVVWSVEMHQQFVTAVNQLGIDKAVPKRILDLMNVEGLTRENVASHLQKYRLYLKRVEGVQNGRGGKLPKPPIVERTMQATMEQQQQSSAGAGASPMPPPSSMSAPPLAAQQSAGAYNPAMMAHMAAWQQQQQAIAMQAAAAAVAAANTAQYGMSGMAGPHMMQPSASYPAHGHPYPAAAIPYSADPRLQPPVSSAIPSYTSHGSAMTMPPQYTGGHGNGNGNGSNHGSGQFNSSSMAAAPMHGTANGNITATSVADVPMSTLPMNSQHHQTPYGDEVLLPSLGPGNGMGDASLGDSLLPELSGGSLGGKDNQDFVDMFIQEIEGAGTGS